MSAKKKKSNLREWFRKHSILLGLIAVGLLILATATWLFTIEEAARWQYELAKALMTISATVIFGGIIKLIFEAYQKEKEAGEKENQDKKLAWEKAKDFKNGLLRQLRNVFDGVDNARLLIEAHKSAKTYGEQMRQEIIPRITTLYEIKRNLVATYAMEDMSKEKIQELRLNIHYMVAYLRVLVEEYKTQHPTISQQQYLYEEVKKRERDVFAFELSQRHPFEYSQVEVGNLKKIENTIRKVPLWVWNAISELEHMGHFISDAHESPYQKTFVDFYEDTKRILKGEKRLNRSSWYLAGHLEIMSNIDKAIDEGKVKKEDNLITILMNHIKVETSKLKE